MTIGDMFDAAFRLYRQHFVTFVGIVALLQVPMAIVQFTLQYVVARSATLDMLRFAERSPLARPGQNPFATIPISSLVTFYAMVVGLALFQGLIVQNLVTGALAHAISRTYLGTPISILSAYGFGIRRYVALILSSVVLLLIAGMLILVFGGCSIGVVVLVALGLRGRTTAMAIALGTLFGVLAALVFVALFLLAVAFFFVRFILTTQAIVLEGRGPLAGMGRSWRLIGGSFWRTLGVFALVLLLSLLISAIPSLLVTFALGLLGGGVDATLRNNAIGTFISQLGLIVGLPLLFSIYTLLYYDLRVRKEGYDIELMAQQAALT